jgi:hypothetical protein
MRFAPARALGLSKWWDPEITFTGGRGGGLGGLLRGGAFWAAVFWEGPMDGGPGPPALPGHSRGGGQGWRWCGRVRCW